MVLYMVLNSDTLGYGTVVSQPGLQQIAAQNDPTVWAC